MTSQCVLNLPVRATQPPVSSCSLYPIGLSWLICQAVCWPPLGSLRYSGLIPVILVWLMCQAVPPAVSFCTLQGLLWPVEQTFWKVVCHLSQYGWWMLYISFCFLSSFFFFESIFYCVGFLLSIAISVSKSLKFLTEGIGIQSYNLSQR